MSSSTPEIEADISKEDGNMNRLIPWKVKQGRPRSIPGCQNTDSLSILAQDVEQCPDGEYCYYYRCRKCLPLLALDCLVPEHTTELVFIPHIDTIKPQKSWMLEVDCGYRGEVVEFYDNYLSRMTILKGVAINAWNNQQAKFVFDSVEHTFKGTKCDSSRDFEIDWLIFDGSSLTVFEVGVRGETEENGKNCKSIEKTTAIDKENENTKRVERLISKKIDQMVQNCLIIQHLLEATGSQDSPVNYLIFFPNITTEMIRYRVEKLHKKALSDGKQFSFDTISSSNVNKGQFRFGFVGSDCIPQKTLQLYLKDGKLGDAILFEDLLKVQDRYWSKEFRYLAATVVTSALMTSKLRSDSETGESNSKSRKTKSDNHKRSIYAAVGWNPKNQAQNRGFKFPEDLVLGPEQLQVINQKLKSKLTILAGEAGCGKTTTLLALLFKYSGKHVTSKKVKKVVFFIPEEKEDFRRDVKNFIKTNCKPEWVEVSPLRSLEKLTVNYENLYLIDEYYGSGPELAKFLSYTSGNFFIALISAQSSHGAISSGFESHTSHVFFRRSYRTPEPISRISSKLRRLIDRKDGKDSHRNIPWAMSFYNGAPMNTRYPFKFLSYSDCSCITSILSDISCELSSRTLCASLDINCFTSKVVDETYHQHTVHHLKSETTMLLQKIPFTGSEFANVIIIFGNSVEPWAHSCLLFLHNAVSRATETVYVLCKDTVLNMFKSLLSVSDESDIVFEKLRTGDNMGSRVLDSFQAHTDKLEVFKRILVRQNRDQYKALATDNLSAEEKQLIPGLRIMQQLSPKKLPELVERLILLNSLSTSALERPQELCHQVIKAIECFQDLIINSSMFPIDNSSMPAHCPLNLDNNMIDYLEALVHDSDRTMEFLRGLFDKRRKQGFQSEVDILGPIWDLEEMGDVFRAFWQIASKRTGQFIVNAKTLYRLAELASPNIEEKLLQKSSSGSCLLHHLTVRRFLSRALRRIAEDLKFSDDDLVDNYNQNCLMLSVTEFETFQVVVNRAKAQNDLAKLLTLRDVYGWTCLRWACRVDNLKVIKSLISHGADWAHDVDDEGRTLIHLVSTFGHAQILQHFLTLDLKQPEPLKVTKSEDNFGMTCLHVACFFGRVDTARLIVEKAPDLMHKTFLGINCLTIASWCIFEDGEELVGIFIGKLRPQTLEKWQKDLLQFCIGKVYRLNFKSFTNSAKEQEFVMTKYLPFIPVMLAMALFDMP